MAAESAFELSDGSFALFAGGAGEAWVGAAGQGLPAHVVEQGAVETDQGVRCDRGGEPAWAAAALFGRGDWWMPQPVARALRTPIPEGSSR
jgi:hypothetical protein